MLRKKDKAERYVVETKQREDKVGEGGVRDPLRDASGPQPIAASDQSPNRYHFPFEKWSATHRKKYNSKF
jgi:hypothetical protein